MIGTRIKQLREERGLDQGQLAYMAGISTAHVYRIEQGGRVPGGNTMAGIAKALDTTADYLLGLTDDPNKPLPPDLPALTDPNFRRLAEAWPYMSERAKDALLLSVKVYIEESEEVKKAMADTARNTLGNEED